MTRDLKLALIIGVTLVLGVAVLISDHLAAGRRPKTETKVAMQPAMTPPSVVEAPPAPKEAAPSVIPVAASNEVQEPIASITQRTKASKNFDDHSDLAREVAKHGGTIQDGTVHLPPASGTVIDTSATGNLGKWSTSPADFGPPVAAKTTGDHTYTTVEGDSAYLIAKRFLGNGNYWKKLREANPAAFGPEGQVKIGAKITIPTVDAPKSGTTNTAGATPSSSKPGPVKLAKGNTVPPLAGVEQAKVKNASYTIKAGDTLSGISKRELGSSNRTEEILQLNRGVIPDPDSLPQGLAIRLPARK